MLAEEMESTAQAQLEGKIEKPEDVYDVLMRAMLQLPDYLEGLQSGNKDTPIVLMPLMNDMRAARNEKLLSESVLFVPDVDSVEIESDVADVAAIEAGRLAPNPGHGRGQGHRANPGEIRSVATTHPGQGNQA